MYFPLIFGDIGRGKYQLIPPPDSIIYYGAFFINLQRAVTMVTGHPSDSQSTRTFQLDPDLRQKDKHAIEKQSNNIEGGRVEQS